MKHEKIIAPRCYGKTWDAAQQNRKDNAKDGFGGGAKRASYLLTGSAAFVATTGQATGSIRRTATTTTTGIRGQKAIDFREEVGCGRQPRVLLLGHQTTEKIAASSGDANNARRFQRYRFVLMLVEDGVYVRALERRSIGEEMEERGAQRVQIRPAIHSWTEDLFGRHIVGRASI